MNKTALFKDIRILNNEVIKHSPAILIFLGITGMASTVVMACKATPKAQEVLKELHEEQAENEEENSKPIQLAKDVKAVAPVYAPAVIMGGISIACIIGSYKITSRRLAAIATAYSISEHTLHEYQNKVIETIGEKKEEQIRDEIAKDRVKENPPSSNEIILTDDGNMLCYDSVFGRYFQSNINAIRKAENTLNRRLISEMYLSANEVFDELGLPPVKLGEDIGWNVDHEIRFSFTSMITEDDRTCLVVDYDISPRYDFRHLL